LTKNSSNEVIRIYDSNFSDIANQPGPAHYFQEKNLKKPKNENFQFFGSSAKRFDYSKNKNNYQDQLKEYKKNIILKSDFCKDIRFD
jgi:hypothetical protein